MSYNLSPDKQQELIAMASKALGKDPKTLTAQLQSGQVESLLQGLNPQQSAQIQSALNNPALLKQLLSNPQVLKMLGKK